MDLDYYDFGWSWYAEGMYDLNVPQHYFYVYQWPRWPEGIKLYESDIDFRQMVLEIHAGVRL